MQIELIHFAQDEIVPVTKEYDPKSLDLEFVDLHYLQPVRLEGTVEKGAEMLSFRGFMESKVEHLCGRCLKKVNAQIHKPFQLYYDIKNKTVIETTDDLREVLIIDHPITFFCNEQCHGLCPKCGTDLNESKCQCKITPDAKPSLAGLKAAWEKKYGGKK